jgi:NAD(P)-dependent dehydrogenase (short-subunit alcohol dehydrogenase family)
VTDQAEHVLADMAGPGGRMPAARFRLDVTVPADIARVRDAIGPIDVLVNNAGLGLLLPVELAEVDLVRRVFEVNVLGALALSQAFLPAMRNRRSGRILAVSSVAARRVRPMTGIYGATKHALEAMLEALRYEVRLFGVDVVVVEPGWVDTDFGRHRLGAGVRWGRPMT